MAILELREQIKNQNNIITNLTYKLETTKETVCTAENQIIYIEKKLKVIIVNKEEKCKS